MRRSRAPPFRYQPGLYGIPRTTIILLVFLLTSVYHGMPTFDSKKRRPPGGKIDTSRLDEIVAQARRSAHERMRGYREQSLRIHPWVCARCGREFARENLHELTVHHKDHDHDNNPADGSNWENLCLYCHDWEHQKYSQQVRGDNASFGLTRADVEPATHNPFSGLKDLLKKPKK